MENEEAGDTVIMVTGTNVTGKPVRSLYMLRFAPHGSRALEVL